ncbi:hypothetical protein BCR37DRAFT_393812 [Protomyces lactucae-debilis]|uniref:Uncharacterized protein n=1 Tax=Protomyces lactucae-debilis TaxID=2754530 RepID=A0A1Y2F952_PROLT|nr:uncharacterized protein BCR37DRAFT_393812 [Protomyces lactucae-debilis]ORY80452.1 hypothetical protein BCR37DRAFT_393812 [Protomyces lactucae-debilis]
MFERDRSKSAWRPSSYFSQSLEDRLEPFLGQRISRKARLLFFDLTLFLGLFIVLHAALWGGDIEMKLPDSFKDVVAAPKQPQAGSQAWQTRFTTQQLTAFEPQGEWDPSSIQRLCRSTQQIPGLYFGCVTEDTQYWESRNMILLCLRYALQMGGSVVMPRIRYQSELGPLSSYFDLTVFRKRISQACPQMQFVETKQQIPNYDALTTTPGRLDPYDLPGLRNVPGIQEHAMGNLYSFQAAIRDYMQSKVDRQPTETMPVFINLFTVHWGWPALYDTVDFWSNWGRLLIPARDYRSLAAHVYDSMKHSTPHLTTLPGENTTSPSYLSLVLVHDETAVQQMRGILSQPEVKALDTRAIYLATRDHDGEVVRAEMTEAIKLAQEQGYHVETRISLMHSPDQSPAIEHVTESGVRVTSTGRATSNPRDREAFAAIKKLRFDRGEIIDWIMHLRSTLFVSVLVADSTHAYARSVAVSRHAWACPDIVGALTPTAKVELARFLILSNITLAQYITAQASGKVVVGENPISIEAEVSAEQQKEASWRAKYEMDPYFRSSQDRDGRSVLLRDDRNEYLYSQMWP